MIASVTSVLLSQNLHRSLAVGSGGDTSLLMLVAAVVAFVVAVFVVKGVVGVIARLAEIAIAIGGTVMVLGLLGSVAVGAYLMSILRVGPFQ